MTKIDDQSLLAMQAARMSPASIAQTMGWRVPRVEKRLRELADAAEAAGRALAGLGQHSCAAELAAADNRFAAPAEPAPVSDKPILPGQALVLRSFSTWGGGHASHAQLANGRRVLIWTGGLKLAPGSRPHVAPMPATSESAAEFQWRAVAERADA